MCLNSLFFIRIHNLTNSLILFSLQTDSVVLAKCEVNCSLRVFACLVVKIAWRSKVCPAGLVVIVACQQPQYSAVVQLGMVEQTEPRIKQGRAGVNIE